MQAEKKNTESMNSPSMSQIDPQIYYLVLLPDDANSSSFSVLHGFSKSVLERSGWIREILVNGPATVHEAFSLSKRNLEFRLACITP